MFAGLLLSLIVGLFFLVGILILNKAKNREKMALFTMSLAFIVMLGLILFDLLPELLEYKNIYLIIPVIIGIILFILLDKLIPHHDEHSSKEHIKHLSHIGVITIFALFLHNLIEGFTLYSVTLSSLTSGILMAISISLHNIPLGFQIGSELSNKKEDYILIFLLCISGVLGSLIYLLFGNISSLVSSILLSLTMGMLIYILIFELFSEIKTSLKKKEVIYGIILGVIIVIITVLM